MNRKCIAKKNNGEVCGAKATRYEIDGTKVNLCKTHLNKLNRDMKITIIDNGEEEIIVDTSEDWRSESTPVVEYEGAQIASVNQIESNINNKEEQVEINHKPIYHFLMEVDTLKGKGEKPNNILARTATTYLKEIAPNENAISESERYLKSLKTCKPVHNILAITTGEYQFHMLQQMLANRGYDFRLTIFKNKDIREVDPALIKGYYAKSTYSYANDSHTFFLKIEGAEWGLAPFGIVEADVKKLMKRLAELFRLAELARFREEFDLNMREFDPEDTMPEEWFDGAIAVSQKFALQHLDFINNPRRSHTLRSDIKAGRKTRWSFRITTPLGLIKGHGFINPKLDKLGIHVMYHKSALKTEFRTTGHVLSTMDYYNPHHTAVYDTQSIINNMAILTPEKQRTDLLKLMADLDNSFKEGVVPDWLLMGEDFHDEDGVPNYERLSEMMHHQYIKWQAFGLDIRLGQNMIFMATNGVIKRLQREIRNKGKHNQFYRKTWTPMTNAFLAGVCTHESLTKMCGFNIEGNDGYMQMDMRFGLIMSGRRFKETYNLHGGWDLDDAVKVILAKIWSDDPARVQALTECGVLDSKIKVPTTKEDAITVALLVRSPNGPGEYSIEALNPKNWMDMPWHQLNVDDIPVANLSELSDGQPMLMEGVTVGTIPESLEYTGLPLTPEQGFASIMAQRINPGIGGICSALMHYSMVFGPSFTETMLARLEQMIDTTQQLRDPVSFAAIADEINNIYNMMLDRLLNEGGQIDKLLTLAYPIPVDFADHMQQFVGVGRFTKFNAFFDQQVQLLQKKVENNSFTMRNTRPMIRTIVNLPVTPETMNWARSFYDRYHNEFGFNAATWSTSDMEGKNPFAAMHFETMRGLANKDTVGRAVAELEAFGGVDTHKRVLSLWKCILTDEKRKLDRILFQPGHDNYSVMDVLIKALIWRGLATEIPSTEE